MITISNYIGGNICNPISEHYLNNFEPATGKVYSLIPDSDHNDVNVAVEAAQKAFPYWSSLTNESRSVWLMKLADKIEEQLEQFAEVESKVNLVTEDIEEVEEKIEFNKQNLINEYESIINRRSLSDAIALNDKFIFVRELFGSQFTEYENNIKKIDEFSSHQEAIDYCKNILSPKYNWENKQSIAGRFFELLSKNFKQ